MSDDRDLARLLLAAADRIEASDRGTSAGLMRAAARRLVERAVSGAGGEACAGCGGEVVQPRLGRPRRFCTTCSPPKRKSREKSMVGE